MARWVWRAAMVVLALGLGVSCTSDRSPTLSIRVVRPATIFPGSQVVVMLVADRPEQYSGDPWMVLERVVAGSATPVFHLPANFFGNPPRDPTPIPAPPGEAPFSTLGGVPGFQPVVVKMPLVLPPGTYQLRRSFSVNGKEAESEDIHLVTTIRVPKGARVKAPTPTSLTTFPQANG